MGGDAHWVKRVELLLALTQVPLQVVFETLVAPRPEGGPSFPVGLFPYPLCWTALVSCWVFPELHVHLIPSLYLPQTAPMCRELNCSALVPLGGF